VKKEKTVPISSTLLRKAKVCWYTGEKGAIHFHQQKYPQLCNSNQKEFLLLYALSCR